MLTNDGKHVFKDYTSLFFKDDSDYLAFKETTWLHSKFVYHSTWASCTAAFSAHSNLLYNDNKYANGTMICTVAIR